MQGVVYKQ